VSLRIVLVRTKDDANIGSVARVMKNFGLSQLFLVAPTCTLTRRAYALASHAGDLLEQAVVYTNLQAAIAGCTTVLGTTARSRTSEGFQVYSPRDLTTSLPRQGGAVVFGPEDKGLSNDELDLCQGYVQIPTAAYASLNLAQAVNLIAYEWFLGLEASPNETEPADIAPREELEAMYVQLLELFHHIGYTDAQREASIIHLYRRLIDRARPSSREVATLRGLWSQAKWAADQHPATLPGRREER
jgi:tRNA/rRNA methyltransferase